MKKTTLEGRGLVAFKGKRARKKDRFDLSALGWADQRTVVLGGDAGQRKSGGGAREGGYRRKYTRLGETGGNARLRTGNKAVIERNYPITEAGIASCSKGNALMKERLPDRRAVLQGQVDHSGPERIGKLTMEFKKISDQVPHNEGKKRVGGRDPKIKPNQTKNRCGVFPKGESEGKFARRWSSKKI